MNIFKTVVFVFLFILNSVGMAAQVILDDFDRAMAQYGVFLSQEFQDKMDVISDSTQVSYDKSLILVNGMMSYPVRYQMIDNAKKSILISTFSIYGKNNKKKKIDQKSTRILLSKLEAAIQRGVEVIVITDGGSSLLSQNDDVLDSLRQMGATLYKYNPIVDRENEAPWLFAIFPILQKTIAGQSPLSNRWHEKTMIVDGKYLLIGGLNWGDIYAYGNTFSSRVYSAEKFYDHPLAKEIGLKMKNDWGKVSEDGWRDTDILLSGEIVGAVTEKFLKDKILLQLIEDRGEWTKYVGISEDDYDYVEEVFDVMYKGDDTFFDHYNKNSSKVRYINQRPYLDNNREKRHRKLRKFAKKNNVFVDKKNPSLNISNYYVNVIQNAQKQIIWGCHSNRPSDVILKALRDAAKRGVKIYLLGNSKESARTLPDKGVLMYRSSFCHYRDLMQDRPNIRLFEYMGETAIRGEKLVTGAFHSKLFSVDGIITSIGSYNVSNASYKKHSEGTIVITGATFAREAEEMYQKDLQFSEEVFLDDLSDEKCAPPKSDKE